MRLFRLPLFRWFLIGMGGAAGIWQNARAQDVFGTLPGEEADEAVGVLEGLVVTAEPAAIEALSPLAELSPHSVRVMEGETLRRNAQGTLGETLAWEPGISSNHFSPGASRPVIRGLEGYRVRTLRDHLDTFDLSDISPDHGVALEPFLLESIEVHRGPATLLYGNSAIGGAVDARSRTLATELPERLVSGGFEQRFESVADGWMSAGHATLRVHETAVTLTGSLREAGDVRIPGKAWSREYERLESPMVFEPGANGESGANVAVPNPRGTLPNSFHEGSTWSAGISWLPTRLPLTAGLAWSRFDSRYGVPYVYPGDPTDLYGDYEIGIGQDRLDARLRYERETGWLSAVEARFGHGWYQHGERFRGKGKDLGRDFTETAFDKNAWEGRLDVHHRWVDGRFTGVAGISLKRDDLEARRAIFPPPDPVFATALLEAENHGAFVLEEFRSGPWVARLGHRVERVEVTDRSLAAFGFIQGKRGATSGTSGSLGWETAELVRLDRLAITGTLSRVERQPTSIERYAFWHNAGIGRFLIGGDMDGEPLRNERSLGTELALEAARGPVTVRLNGFQYRFDDFIFLQEDPAATGGFGRAVRYIGRDAEIRGFEAEMEWKLHEAGERQLTLTWMSDHVRGHNETDDEPLPRMPPWRTGARLEWRDERMTAGLEIRHAASQKRVKPEPRRELPADAYTLVNADVSWKFGSPGAEWTAFLRATNLLDEEARPSTSFRKDVAPLPGRGISLGVSVEF